jgi:hypothetical protein
MNRGDNFPILLFFLAQSVINGGRESESS